MNANRNQLAKQFASVKSYLPAIKEAGETHGFTPSLLLDIGSRETNFAPKYQKFPGDAGHGFSWWQIDKRSYPEFIASGEWKHPEKAVKKAAAVLDEKMNELIDLTVKQRPASEVLLRLTIAAYNCGSGSAYHNWSTHSDPDRGTTGHDYSADVLEREEVFRELLEADKEEVDPPSTVVTTVSTKVESGEKPKEQPPPAEISPQTAITVPKSESSLWSRMAAFGHWIVAGIVSVGLGIDAVYDKILGFAVDRPIFLVLLIFIGILVICGTFLWDRSQERANQRTLKAADIAADKDKNNIYFGASK